MSVLLLFTSVVVCAQSDPVDFRRPGSISQAEGVRIDPQPPAETAVLIAEDSVHPALWYSPCATHSAPEGILVWYQRVDTQETEFADKRTLCLGMLSQGRWTLPSLSGVSSAWGGPNNVAMRRSPYKPTWGGFNVFQILRVEERFEMVYWDQPNQGEAGVLHATSTDGKVWQTSRDKALFTEHNDAFTVLSLGKEYLMFQTMLEDWPDKPVNDNLPGKRRVIALRKSPDLQNWTSQELLLHPDTEDRPDTEFYLFKAFPYRGGYCGLLLKYFADPTKPGKHSGLMPTEVLLSDDARSWRRPFRHADFGFWTYADPLMDGGKLRFVAWKGRSMVLLSYDPGRLFAAAPTQDVGEFRTQPFAFSHGGLAIDADAHGGWLEADLLDESGAPVNGCRPVRIEGTEGPAIRLGWQGFESVQPKPAAVQVRFRLHRAKLFGIARAE